MIIPSQPMEPFMRKNMKTNYLARLLLVFFLIQLSQPKDAQADLFSLWLKPKVDYINGSGEVFKRIEGSAGFGIEAGLELLSISIWADYQKVGDEQYWASGNLGYDFDLEIVDGLTFMIGGYLGLIWFGFPPSDASNSDQDLKANLMSIDGLDAQQISEFIKTYEKFQSAEESTANMAYGANARVRLSLEYEVIPFVSLGVEGLMGWHAVISGEEAAAGFKAKAIKSFIDDQKDKIPAGNRTTLENELKSKLGAEDIDTNDLKGIHYTAGAFLSVRF